MIRLNKGLYTDSNLLDTPEGTWSNAENCMYINDVLQREYGTSQLNIPDKKLLGYLNVNNDLILFFQGTDDEIGIIRKNTDFYETLVEDSNFNFNEHYPIKAKFFVNNKKEIIIVWTDEFNPLRFLNINKPQPINSTRINVMGIGATTGNNHISATIKSGGSLQAGVYVPFYRFITEEGISSNYVLLRDIKITNSKLATRISSQGTIPNEVTDKSILLTFTNLDSNYRFLEIGFISTVNEITTFTITEQLEIKSSTIVTNIVNNKGIVVDPSEILTQKGNYPIVKDLEVVRDQLLIAGLKSQFDLAYQKYALDIRINYLHTLGTVYKLNNTFEVPKTFMYGEVYAFYIIFKLTDDSLSKAYHIPGRASIAGDTDNSTLGTWISGVPNRKKYRIEDRTNLVSQGAATNMGYWENDNETYPNTNEFFSNQGRDLRGQKVLHHRFPSLKKLRADHYSFDTEFAKNKLPLLSIEVDNVVIPTHLLSLVKGYYIGYSKRTIENMCVLGYSDMQSYGVTNATIKKANNVALPVNENIGTSTPAINLPTFNASHIRFKNFDLLYNKPRINPVYVWNELKLLKNNISYTGSPDKQTIILLSDYSVNGALITDITITNTTNQETVAGVEEYNYIPENSVLGDVDNRLGSEHLSIKGNFTECIGTGKHIVNTENKHPTFLSCLRQNPSDVYFPFYEQFEIVLTNDYVPLTIAATYDNREFKGGDCVIDMHFYIDTCPKEFSQDGLFITNAPTTEADFKGKGVRILKGISIPAVSIHTERYFDKLDTNSYVYPQATVNSATYLSEYDIRKQQLMFYDKSLNVENSINNVISYNPYLVPNVTHPNRIARSIKYNRNSYLFNIFFPPNSYYEVATHKGVIVGINEFNNRLLIRCENTTFLTIPNQRVQTSAGEATLGNNDLFDIEPDELISTDYGFAGSTSKFNSIKTEFGITIIDSYNGKIFLFASQLEEITRKGNRLLFEKNFRVLNKRKRFVYENIDYVNWEDDKIAFMIPNVNNIYSFSLNDLVYSYIEDKFIPIVDIRLYNEFLLLCTNLQDTIETYKLQIVITNNNSLFPDGANVSQASSTPATGEVLYTSGGALYIKVLSGNFVISGINTGGNIVNDDTTNEAQITSVVVTTTVIEGNVNDTITIYKEVDDVSYNDISVGYDSLFQRLLFTKNEILGFSDLNYRGYIADNMTFNLNDIVINDNVREYDGDDLIPYSLQPNRLTYSFCLKDQIWISKHSYTPNLYLNKTDEILYFSTGLFKMNNKLLNGDNCIIEIIFNRENMAYKMPINIEWKTLKYNLSNVLQNSTFDTIKFENENQVSNLINLIILTALDTANANTRQMNGVWNFNLIRDNSNNYLVGSYIKVIFGVSGENLLSLYGYDIKYNILNK